MERSLFLAGIVVVHVLVWGLVRQMRREGQHIRRLQLAGFVAMELVLGVLLAASGSLSLLVWLAANAGFVLVSARLSPPPPQT